MYGTDTGSTVGLNGKPRDRPYQSILVSLTARLMERSSRLVVDGQLDPEFLRNVVSILDEAVALIERADHPLPAVAIDYAAAPRLTQAGRIRAEQKLHPAESLMAAEVLFDVAAPILAADRALVPDTSIGAISAMRALHHAIWRRFPPGAIAYAEGLRQQLSAAHQESRLRMSRDFHDRIAHGIAAGIQRIELADLIGPREGSEMQANLRRAATILRDTLEDVRDLAVELRSRVGDLALDEALRRYASNTSTSTPLITVEAVGTPRLLRGWVAEELFTIALEGIRNARTHATGATSINVCVNWADEAITVEVTDDGSGFRQAEIRQDSLGILNMTERAEMIGAQFLVSTAPGEGTTIRLCLPLETVLGVAAFVAEAH